MRTWTLRYSGAQLKWFVVSAEGERAYPFEDVAVVERDALMAERALSDKLYNALLASPAHRTPYALIHEYQQARRAGR